MSLAVICQSCGTKLEIADDYRPNRIQCSQCGVMCDLPRHRQRKPASRPARSDSNDSELSASPKPVPIDPPSAPAVPQSTKPARKPQVEDEDDDRPYELVGGPIRVCSTCHRELPMDAKVCNHCGFDFRAGAKVEKKYEPLVRHWEGGLPHGQRVGIYLACQLFALVGLVTAGIAGELGVAIPSWLLFSAMLAFLLGTYEWVDLVRDSRGKIRLNKGWRFFFVPRPLPPIKLSEYDGVVSGKDRSADFWDWTVFVILIPFAVFPGILWWYFAINRDSFFVALSQHHGSPSYYLYRGWNQEVTQEIANTIRDACGLTYQR